MTPTNDPKVFTANYTSTIASVGSETISITNASYADQAGNNGGGFSLNQQIATTPPSTTPSVTISSDKLNLELGQKAILTSTFSEAPFGFTVNDISATNGTLGSLIVDPNNARVYTATFTPAREIIGNSVISVTNGSYTNSANIPGLGAAISPSLAINTKTKGFVATGDDSDKAGRRINQTNEMSGTSVVLYDPTTGEASGSTVPFNNYQGQVRVARGDINNDGILEMIVSTGPGGLPEVKIIDSGTGNMIGEIMAYDPSFKCGIFVSIIDVNNDGFSEIVTGAGESGGPHVKIFDSRTKSEILSFFAFDAEFRGGVSVAAYDVDRDGILDIVTGAGPGGGPHVKVFSGRDMHIIKEFMAYDFNFRGGVFVAIGDFMSDGTLEIITGPGIGGGPHLKVWDYSTLNLIAEKMVYDKFTKDDGQVIDFLFAGGVRVGIADGNDDGILDVIVGAGPTGGPHVKVLAGFDLEVIRNFFSGEKTDSRGVFVSQ